MSEQAADSTSAPPPLASRNAAAIDDASSAAIAGQVAKLTSRDGGANAGVLPVWNRVASQPTSRWTWLLLFAGWGATIFLLIVAALRIVRHDAVAPLTWLNAFTMYVYLPAYAVLAVAVWMRRWWLVSGSALVVACHVAWVAPDFRPATPFPAQPAGSVPSTPIRIYFANVRAGNEDPKRIWDEIIAVNPDVIALCEVGREWHDTLRDAPFMKPYKYGTNLNEPLAGEEMVFSRLPVSHQEVIWTTSRVNKIIDIPIGEESLRVFCLHSPRPLNEEPQDYATFWNAVKPMLAQQPEPLVVIGDFNATQHARVFQELTATRLRSAHIDRGRGYATSWPNGMYPVPPIRIDQALLSPAVECLDIEEGAGPGSDHKSLILDISVHSRAPAAVSAAAMR